MHTAAATQFTQVLAGSGSLVLISQKIAATASTTRSRVTMKFALIRKRYKRIVPVGAGTTGQKVGKNFYKEL